jgi:hypothetical protein
MNYTVNSNVIYAVNLNLIYTVNSNNLLIRTKLVDPFDLDTTGFKFNYFFLFEKTTCCHYVNI